MFNFYIILSEAIVSLLKHRFFNYNKVLIQSTILFVSFVTGIIVNTIKMQIIKNKCRKKNKAYYLE